MMRRRLMLTLLVAAVLAMPLTTRILGQVRQQSGAALDANLQLGSGGYNSPGRGAVGQRNTARLYRSPYSVSRPGSVRRDQYNTFMQDRQYNVARSVGNYGGGGGGRGGFGAQGSPAYRRETAFSNPSAALPRPAPPASGGAATPVETVPDETQAARLMEQISYGIGFYLGQEIRAGIERDGVAAAPNDVIRGFGDGLAALDPAVPRDEIEAILASIHDRLQAGIVERRLAADPQFKTLHDENLARSRAFHEAYGVEEGVITLPGGIQYEVLVPGTGESPAPTDTVVVNIRISRIDGTEIARWDGAEVEIDSTVAAGAQVLPMMKAGARWRTAIPPELAYGAEGSPPAIGPNETILAEIELLEIR
jgi:FKBP-type peptidyl-prolyl cis-trans isomerase FklB